MIASARYLSNCSLLDAPLAISLDNSVAPQDQQIRQAQNGNLEAFNEMVLTYQDCVFRQALWLLNDEAAAEDASQEAFYRAYRKIHTFDGPSFRTWIMRITTKNYRIPIILVDIQEMNYQDAAQVLGMRLETFKSRLSRGRARLLEATLRMPNADLLFS